MKPAPFEYRRMRSVPEVLKALAEDGDEAKVMAGGQSLIPLLNFRLATPGVVLDIGPLAALRSIHRAGPRLSIGSLATHGSIERSAGTAEFDGYALLPSVASLIGHLPIRNRGTIGGSIAHADPAAEWPLAAVLLDATIVVASTAGERALSASEFFLGLFTTAMQPDELLVRVEFERPPGYCAVREFARRRGDFAIVSVGVAFDMSRRGRCVRPRVVIGGVTGTAVRAPATEQALADSVISPDLVRHAAQVLAQEINPRSDAQGSGDYRRALARDLFTAAMADARKRSGVAVAI